MNLSIIIPTRNEEGNIARCLDSVLRQDQSLIKEIIIADNQSNDRTLAICQNYPVKIVAGGLPVAARNKGARAATSDYIMFLDADTQLPADFLPKALAEFTRRQLGIASFFYHPQPATIPALVTYGFYGWYSYISARLHSPFFATCACCLLVDKKLHDAIGGFDETMACLEEYDYIKRIKRLGRFGVIPQQVITSTRRFSQGCALKKTAVLFIYYFQWLLTGKVRRDYLGYWK